MNMKLGNLACILAGLLFICSTASDLAAAPRTFVSASGNDNDPCTLLKPCRTFNRAISQTDSGGEVVVLSSAGYGTFTVSKAVTVEAPPGVYAGITVTGSVATIAIDINAGSSDAVTLRGLSINSLNPDSVGVRFLNGAVLHVENCAFNSNEIGVWSIGAGSLDIRDSVFTGNLFGIRVEPTSGTASATVENVKLQGNADGLDAFDGARVTAHNTVASGNSNLGFGATSFTTRSVELNVESCVASNNAHNGIAVTSFSTGTATVRLASSTITNNAVVGLDIGNLPATLLSRGNNTVEGNAIDVFGTLGSYLPK